MSLAWKRIRSGEWIGQEGELTYTIRQSGGARFILTRAVERMPFATLRALTFAKVMAEQDANERRASHGDQ